LKSLTYDYLPRKSLIPVIEQLIEKSMAPFVHPEPGLEKGISEEGEENILKELAYFPSLPKVGVRGVYKVDSRKAVGCTKRSGGHPTLLPGIFTLYCPHGELTLQHAFEYFTEVATPCRNLLWIPGYASA
jgi:hypothetical protein